MHNEALFLFASITELLFILFFYRLGKGGLVASIAINITLVSVTGSFLVPLFGSVSNIGNIFYASVFFATSLLNEYYGKREAYTSVMISFTALVLFSVMAQLTTGFTNPTTTEVPVALITVFNTVPRIALASMAAYVVAQSVNVWLYDAIKTATKNKKLWLRNITAAASAQFVDSLIFFSIAFAGTVSFLELRQVIIVGFLLKTAFAVLSTPFLYWSRVAIEKNDR
jgi:uncharacterized integral membrane protein (TIGR00697 family)